MFKFFKWTVLLRSSKSGFFIEPTSPGFLCRMANSDVGVFPLFGEDPSLYTFARASFLVSELRRVGYYVFLYPYCLIVLRGRIKLLVSLLRQRRLVRMKWKK